MKTITVHIEKNPVQITNCPQNYMVAGDGWDLGDPIGHGATKEAAIEDYKESWLLHMDEEIEISEI